MIDRRGAAVVPRFRGACKLPQRRVPAARLGRHTVARVLPRLRAIVERGAVPMSAGPVAAVCRVLQVLRRFPIRVAGIGAAALLLSWLTSHAHVLHDVTLVLRLIALGLMVGAAGWWVIQWMTPALSTREWVSLRDQQSNRAGGVATWLDITERAEPSAMRARARILRPSMAWLPVWRRWQVSTRAFAVPLVSAG